MTNDRRGEAHLWLLLEEALRHVRNAEVEPWEAWRNFRAVTDALVVVGSVAPEVGEALVGELDDALAVRGVIPAGAFSAAPWPDLDILTATRPAPPVGAAVVWLEAEIERHLDLFVSFGTEAQAWAASDLVRILSGPVAGFRAVQLLEERDERILEDVVATLAAAGVDAGRSPHPEATARESWVDFLRARPAALPEPHVPTDGRLPRLEIGGLGAADVRVDAVMWSEDAIDVEVAVRTRSSRPDPLHGAPWHARILDDRGHLHLGQTVQLRRGAGMLRFSLRPGVGPGVNRLDVRITRGGARVEGSVEL